MMRGTIAMLVRCFPVGCAASRCCAALLVALGVSAAVCADDLILDIPDGTIHAGVPFVVRVLVEDDDAVRAEPFPAADGLVATGPPSLRTSRSTTIINGRMTQRATTQITYELVADDAGFVTIPQMIFEGSRGMRRTAPRTIMVSRIDAGDIIDVAITSDRRRYYVGEPVELLLEIAIRRFDDERFSYTATAENTFQWIDDRASRLGVFGSSDQRTPPRTTWQEIERPDATGRMVPWYLFKRVFVERPTAAGKLEIDPVSILVRFPQRMARRTDMLGRGTLQIVDEQLALGRAKSPPIEILAPPAAGRPETFHGAVGVFSVSADAQPRSVAVGDPVTLRLRIRDETEGGVRLDMLAPPVLDRVPALVRHFRIPSDPLAGVIEEPEKVFTQTIRPLDDAIREVPPIPFTYFDPKLERYVTIETAPIPIEVSGVERLTLDEVIAAPLGGSRAAQRSAPGMHHPSSEPADLLRGQRRWSTGEVLVVLGAGLSIPPLLASAMLMVRRRRSGAAAQRLLHRRHALRTALQGVERGDPVSVCESVTAFIGALAGRTAGATTGEEAVRLLGSSGLPDELSKEAVRMIRGGEHARYGGGFASTEDSAALARSAAEIVRKLDQEWPT